MILNDIKIILIFVLNVCNSIHNYRIGSKCGFPGLPHETKIEPKKGVYDDGEEVRYNCPSDEIYLKTQVKKCVAGVWTGPRSTCGYFIRNQVTDVKVIDLSTNETIVDMKTSNYTNTEFPVSYYDGQGRALKIVDPHLPRKWTLVFSNPTFFDFFLLNVRIPKSSIQSQIAINEIDAIRVKNVTVLNESNRTCSIDFATRSKWAKIFWFWCTESRQKVFNETLSISFISYANQPMKVIGLHQVYLTKLQYCGHPAVPLLAHYVPQNEENNQIQCNQEISKDFNSNRNTSELIYSDSEEDLINDCIDNEYWAGRPKCIPKVFCELRYNELIEEISSVENAYIFDESKWYAIEGTSVHFKCKTGNEFVTDAVRTCIYNMTWDQTGPICQDKEIRASESSLFKSSSFLIPIITSLIVIIILITLLVVVIIRRRNKRTFETNAPKSSESDPMGNNLNIYEDVHYGVEEYSEYSQYNAVEYDDNYNQRKGDQPDAKLPPGPYYLGIATTGEENNLSGDYIQMWSKKPVNS